MDIEFCSCHYPDLFYLKPHKLSGNYKGYWECHVKPDLLMIWDENEQINLLKLARAGTHADPI